jgi:uncharacterized membrane protein YhiD involved in acid resistance
MDGIWVSIGSGVIGNILGGSIVWSMAKRWMDGVDRRLDNMQTKERCNEKATTCTQHRDKLAALRAEGCLATITELKDKQVELTEHHNELQKCVTTFTKGEC